MSKEFYLPDPDAVSVFSDKPDVVNQQWIEENRAVMLGIAIQEGIEKFDA